MKGHLKILILITILAAGIIAQKMDLLDLTRAVAEIEGIADLWWVPPASVLIQVILYLFALPGFPHSIINYSAGMLKVKLLPFILSSTVGFALKGYIYCSAIYAAFHIEEKETAMTVWPLLVLAGFSLAGILIRKMFFDGGKQAL